MLHWQFYSVGTGDWFWEVSGQEGPIAKSPPYGDFKAAQADAMRLGYKPPPNKSGIRDLQEAAVHQSS